MAPASREERVRLTQQFSSKVDPTWRLNNFASEHILTISDKLRLRGFLSKHGVVNYLGIPFARTAARFLSAKLLELDQLTGTLDATLYGPRPPQGADVPHWLFENLFEKLGGTRRMSEMDCLVVNIYTPPNLKPGEKVPVFAYIHGGAFAHGDSGTEQDGNHLVARSLALSSPIIVISIAYRLNFFGFLTSHELLADQIAHGELPIRNQGTNDQRVALQWIQKYVHLFGGDPSLVTLSGESAGGHSVWEQMKGNVPDLFWRANPRSFPPARSLPFEEAQARFDGLIEKLGINVDAPGAVKVAALRSLSAEELVGFWDGSPFPPVLDPGWLVPAKEGVEFGSVEYYTDAPEWLDAVMLGCTQDEAILFSGGAWNDWNWEQAKKGLAEVLPPHIVDTVVKSEAWTGHKRPVEAFNAVVSEASFCGGIVQGGEMLAARNRGRTKVYFYIMQCPQEQPGELQGWMAHATDVSVVFYQPAQQEFPEQAAVADQNSEYLLKFVHGREMGEWKELDGEELYMAFSGRDSGMRHLHRDRRDREVLFEREEERKVFYGSGFEIIGASLRRLNQPDQR